MGETTVRSPWNTTGTEPMRGHSPGAYSNPGNQRARADSGHLVRSPGKGGGPASVSRRDNATSAATPVQGASYRDPTDPGTDMADCRHHVARPVVVLVPVPCGGSPQPIRTVKPGKYPSTQRAPWRPQRSIPTNGKAAATKRLLDAINRNDAAARAMLTPNVAMLRSWLARAA
jgi:hypothetical protein